MNSKPLSELLEEAFVKCRDMDASLAERLQAFAEAVRDLGPIFQSSVDDLVTRLRAHEVGEAAPKPGDKMPDFVLPDERGQLVSLDQLLKRGRSPLPFIGVIGARIAASTPRRWPKPKGRSRPRAGRSPPSCRTASTSPLS